MNLDSSIREIKGIGAKTEEMFQKAGVYTIRDILLYFPRDYEKFPEPVHPGQVLPDRKNAVIGKITKRPSMIPGNRLQLVTTEIGDASGRLRMNWFRSPYVRNVLEAGKIYIFYGIVHQKKGILTMDQPEII